MTACTDYDVVIAGSGPAGTAAAITLARKDRRVLVLEKRQVARFNVGETIAPSAKSMVEGYVGPLGGNSPDWATKYRGNMSIWGDERPFSHDFFFGAYGDGLCVKRDGFDGALRQAARSLGVRLWRGASVTAVRRDPADDLWAITVAGPRRQTRHIRAAYLIDATGRAGSLGRLLGIKRGSSDPLTGFALRFVSSAPEPSDRDGFSRIEASPYGWWYCNRLPSAAGVPAERVAVLHSDPGLPQARQAATPAGFLELLARTKLIGPFLETQNYRPTGRVRGAAAGSARASACALPDFLAIGDAAQAYDPLSSQGLHRALESGGMAGQALLYALANPDGPDRFLARYDQHMRQTWDRYAADYCNYYAMERRWPDQPFWRSRHPATAFSPPIHARDV